jgi:hypothetical protein
MRPPVSAMLKGCGVTLVTVAIAEMMWMSPAPALSTARSEKPQTPDRWTRLVCRDVSTWLKARGEAETGTVQALGALKAGDVNPKTAKTGLMRANDRAVRATDEVVDDVRGAGTPNVNGGKQVVGAYVRTLRQYGDAYERAHTAFTKAGTADRQQFSAEAQEIDGALEADLAAVGVDPVEELRAVPELAAAITSSCGDVATYLGVKVEPPCQAVLTTARYLTEVDAQEAPLPDDSPQLDSLVDEELRAFGQLQTEFGGCNVAGVPAPCQKPFETARRLAEVWNQYWAAALDSPEEQALYDELIRTYDALRNDLAAMCR